MTTSNPINDSAGKDVPQGCVGAPATEARVFREGEHFRVTLTSAHASARSFELTPDIHGGRWTPAKAGE